MTVVIAVRDPADLSAGDGAPFIGSAPKVVGLIGGDYVVTWSGVGEREGGDIFFQRYSASGDPLGGVVTASSVPIGLQSQPSVAALNDGGFVLSWTDASQTAGDQNSSEIRAAVFDANGARVGAELLVNTTVALNQGQPSVVALATGGFAVSWLDESNSVGTQDDVRYQLFYADGTRQGPERLLSPFPVNGNDQSGPQIAALNDGFAIMYGDVDAGGQGVFIKRSFNAAGQLYNQTVAVNTLTTGQQRPGGLAALKDGTVATVYIDEASDTLRLQLFTSSLDKLGDDRAISTAIGNVPIESVVVRALDSGGFAVVWSYDFGSPNAQTFARIAVFDENGDASTGEVALSGSVASEFLLGPSFDQLASGDLVVGSLRVALNEFGGLSSRRYGLFEQNDGTDLDNTIIGLSGRDRVLAYSGADTVFGGESGDFIRGGAGDDDLSGDDGDDLLFGDSGSDILLGGEGDDVLEASGGGFADSPDELVGGDGSDTVSYAGATIGLRADLTDPSLNAGDAAGDTYSGIENLTGTDFEDLLIGDAGANTLKGGAGGDVLVGGPGGDTFIGGTGDDLVSYSAAAAAVTVNMATLSANTGEAAGDSYRSIEAIQGSAFGDVLRGVTGVQVLSGGAGDDVLEGRAGADQLVGGDGLDAAGYGLSAARVVVDLGAAFNNEGDAEGDTFNGVEAVIGSNLGDTLRGDAGDNRLSGGAGADVLQGRAGADVLTGGTGADLIFGEDGNDLLEGGDGGDTLQGGAGDDLFRGQAGADIIDGGAGQDVADFRDKTTAVVVALNGASNVAVRVGGVVEDTMRNVERVYGGGGADVLTGDALANQLYGFGGSDVLRGGLGADFLIGGEGVDVADYRDKTAAVVVALNGSVNVAVSVGGVVEDTIREIEAVRGGSAGDVITGDALANQLIGEAGNDRLRGGAGADSLSGGLGGDVFVYGALGESTVAATGRDVLIDFQTGLDDLDVSLIDANTGAVGDQAFTLGALASGQAGRLQVTASGAGWLVQGDVTGDGVADFAIQVNGSQPVAGDFVL